jgi:phosphoribosyl 1,2-cyclic phosphate phosphodiesterase
VIAGAGERWDKFVDYTIAENLGGLENLAGIPGDVGASPVQNVGAYGVEACDRIYAVECFDLESRRTVTLTNEECCFAYRDSRFKHDWKHKYIVLRVAFKLNPSTKATNLTYGPLAALESELGHTPTIRDVRDKVITIRNSKLPDPKEIGSAGSYFKNPIVNPYYFQEELLPHHPDISHHFTENGMVKLSAAWLIDHSGMKGVKHGGAQVFQKQPLVLVNANNATGADVVALAKEVQETVFNKFGVVLTPEVNYINSSIKVTVLGSGTSKGVPELRCNCRVCRSTDIHDKRLRASILVQTHGINLLIDPSPDFRQQAMRADIRHIDAVLITHSHFDHVGGLDDLRPYCLDGDLHLYMRKDVDDDLRRRIDYCFRENLYPGVPVFKTHIIDPHNPPITVCGIKVTPIEVMHGKIPICGYRIGNFAYITDAKTIDEQEIEKLRGVDTLIINALRHRPHFAHLSVEESIKIINEINPRKAYLTHICHDLGLYAEENAKLPEGIALAYDGMTLNID